MLCWQGLHVHAVDDSVQYIESNIRETRRDKINTSCCWNKLSVFKSLESSDSEQRVEGCQENPGRTKGTTGKPRKRVASAVAHQSTLIAFHLSLDKLGGTYFPVFVETGLARSRMFSE